MEMCNEDAIDLQEESSKLKPKKKSLCRLLMEKKTKVGCLSTESEEVILQENFQNNCNLKQKEETKDESSNVVSPIKGNSSITKAGDNQNKDSAKEVHEIHRLGSPRDFSNTTKLALCCAMTESSRSLNHQHVTNYHRSNGIERSNQGEECVSKTAVSVTENVKKVMQSINKTSSVDETYLSSACSKEVAKESHLQENCCQSVPVSRRPSMRISPSSSPSEISSCDSSPQMQMLSQAHLRRRLLAQRRSVDNLLISSLSGSSPSPRHSSLDSGRSSPDPIQGYKKRSSSHDTVLPPHQDEMDKRVSIPSRGSHGNLAPENGAVHGIIASMDSLARQSLLAAQVLHLIPTTKARERYKNFSSMKQFILWADVIQCQIL
jgi:phosphatidylinositol-bisphosphatase